MFIALVIVLIPTAALALKSNSEPKETKSPQNIHNEITKKIELEPFPVGEIPKTIPTPTPPPKPAYKPSPAPTGTCVDWIRQAGISDVTSAYKLIMRESGCRVNATNSSSGAYGIPQSLPASKMATAGADYRTNPITQLRWMNHYCLSRYGSWANAYNFQISHGWY